MNEAFAASLAAHVDAAFSRYLDDLVALCRIPSISAENRDLDTCVALVLSRLERLGFEGAVHRMPNEARAPIVVARREVSPGAPTLLIYGHFDVQPPGPEAAWDSPPFEPTLRDGRLYGRGTADDKAQFSAHLAAFDALDALGRRPALNVVFVLDSQEEVGSVGLPEFVAAHQALLAADYVLYADGHALPSGAPIVQFGSRGSCKVILRVRSAKADAHSGIYGGVLPNAAMRLTAFLSTLADDEGAILIEGFHDNVRPPSPRDLEAAARLSHDPEAFRQEWEIAGEIGRSDLPHWHRVMFQPCLNVTSLTAGYQGPGVMNVIPCEAEAKLNIRIVKDQTPEEIEEKLRAHAARHGYDDVAITFFPGYRPARTSMDHPMGGIVAGAVRRWMGVEPALLPSIGGSNPNYVWMETLGLPMVEVSYAGPDAGFHAPNENMSLDRFRAGILASAEIFVRLAALGRAAGGAGAGGRLTSA